jgi:hypothetical protein
MTTLQATIIGSGVTFAAVIVAWMLSRISTAQNLRTKNITDALSSQDGKLDEQKEKMVRLLSWMEPTIVTLEGHSNSLQNQATMLAQHAEWIRNHESWRQGHN